jgi:polyhydroxyalkanoate synthesis regulator phasin
MEAEAARVGLTNEIASAEGELSAATSAAQSYTPPPATDSDDKLARMAPDMAMRQRAEEIGRLRERLDKLKAQLAALEEKPKPDGH